jgi:hypothetical protein
MKKLFFRYAIGFLPFIAVFSGAYAQQNEVGLASANPKHEIARNKSKITDMPVTEGITTVAISSRAVKNFAKTYDKVSSVNWFVIKDGYLAEFNADGIKTKVFYDRKGYKTASMRCYFEDKLPKHIRHLVKSHYYDYHIYYVQEVTVDQKTAFLVKIKDDTTFKTIRVVDGEMDETESFGKRK